MAKRKTLQLPDLDISTGISTINYLPIKYYGVDTKLHNEVLTNTVNDTLLQTGGIDETITYFITCLISILKNHPRIISYLRYYEILPHEIKTLLELNPAIVNLIYKIINPIIHIVNTHHDCYRFFVDTGIDGIQSDFVGIALIKNYLKSDPSNITTETLHSKHILLDSWHYPDPDHLETFITLSKMFNRKYDLFNQYDLLSKLDQDTVMNMLFNQDSF